MYTELSLVAQGDPAMLHTPGQRFQFSSQLEQALEMSQRAKEVEPDSARRRVRVGELQMKMGTPPDARKSFEKAIELEPREASAHFHMSLLESKHGSVEEAMRHIHAAMEIKPEIEKYRTHLNKLYSKQT